MILKKKEKIEYFRGNFAKKMNNSSENIAKIDALFTKSLTFFILILNFLTPPLGFLKNIHPCHKHHFSHCEDRQRVLIVNLDAP